jgi:uncharacterized membrane protein
MELLMGMTGALLILGGFFLGLGLGREHRDEKKEGYREARSAEEIAKERRRLIEDQEAFRQQMEYNADVAYGMSGNEEMYK